MPTHPHQAGVIHILWLWSAYQNSYLFTRTSTLPAGRVLTSFENLTKYPPSCASFLHPKVSSEHSTHGRLTFPDTLLQKRTPTGDALVVSQVEMRKDGFMPEVDASERELQINLLKSDTLLQLWIYSQKKILQYNTRTQTSKAYRSFDPRLHLGGLNSPKDPSWLAYSAKLSSHFTCIWFLKVGIPGFGVKPQDLTKLGTFESLPYITTRMLESFHKYSKRFLSRKLKRLDNKPAIKCHSY